MKRGKSLYLRRPRHRKNIIQDGTKLANDQKYSAVATMKIHAIIIATWGVYHVLSTKLSALHTYHPISFSKKILQVDIICILQVRKSETER